MQIDGRHAFVGESDFVLHYAGDIVGVSDEGGPVIAGLVPERSRGDGACLFHEIVHCGKYTIFLVR